MSSQAALLLLVGVLLANPAAITGAASPRAVETELSSNEASNTLWNNVSARPDDPEAHIIAVLTSKHLVVERFQHVCAGKQQETDNRARQTAKGIPSACWLLQGSCHRLFRASIPGIAGRFTRQQVKALQECAGPDGIAYMTRDNQVKKAEGDEHRNWWTYRAPANMTLQQLQQLAASKLGAATAAGVTSGTANAISKSGNASVDQSSSSAVPPQATSSSGPQQNSSSTGSSPVDPTVMRATMGLIQRWILAEVGLASQAQLSKPGLHTMQVQAADGQPEQQAGTVLDSKTVAAEPQVTSQVSAAAEATDVQQLQEGAVSAQVPGSKNQDPGIPVDVQAVTNPDIFVRTTGGSSSSQPADSEELQQPLSLAAAERANKEPGVKEQRLVTALWNLDRVDQQQLPLNRTFTYGTPSTPGTGKGVTIYVLDSGIRAAHQEFQPWDGSSSPNRITVGPDFVDKDGVGDDCDGHGTHVASTAAGRSVGVAKEAQVVAVRVLDCEGAGTISNVVAGLDWVAANAVKPAVVSLSLGVPAGSWSKPMEDAIAHFTEVLGISVVVASGNSAKNSCEIAPARAPTAITVAASNIPTKFGQTRAGDTENLYSWSNTGACVKLFAPGVDIYGACGGASRCATLDDSSYTWASGTSMAAPHVTGAVAVYLEKHPTATPKDIMAALIGSATTGHLSDAAMLPGTPNKLLFTGQQ